MDIHVASDFHFSQTDHREFTFPGDVIVIAGDICAFPGGIARIAKAATGRPVIIVAGNHDFDGAVFPNFYNAIRATVNQYANMYFLENEAVTIGDITFYGCTLWTDFTLYGNEPLAMLNAPHAISDFKNIKFHDAQLGIRNLIPSDMRDYCLESKRKLEEYVMTHQDTIQRTVVVTHFLPDPECISVYFRDSTITNPYFCTPVKHIEHYGVALWAFGHSHHQSDFMIGSTRMIANPVGFREERYCQYDPEKIVTVTNVANKVDHEVFYDYMHEAWCSDTLPSFNVPMTPEGNDPVMDTGFKSIRDFYTWYNGGNK